MTAPVTPPKSNRIIALAPPSPAAQVSARSQCPDSLVRHPVLVGPRQFLRALRAAEMAAWEAGMLWPAQPVPGASRNTRP